MASWIYFSACIVATIVLRQVSGTTLTINPSQVQIGGANPTTLNGTCIPPAQAQIVLSITIGRKHLSSGDETAMVDIVVTVNNNQPVIQDGNLRSRLSVQGDINNNPKSLSFSLKDPTCNDIKDYTFYCKTQITPDSAELSKEDFRNVTYRVNPDTVKMTMFPSYENFDPGTLVTFTCTGLIGSVFPTDQSNFWIWEWRDVSQTIPTSWTRYPSSANITYGTPTQAANCNYNGRSELKHTVTEFDVRRQFRCYIVNPELYSANATIKTQDDTTPDPGASTNGDSNPDNAGMIAGIVIGVLAAIVIVVVLVYFLVFRRKNSGGDDYDTGEGKENGPEMADHVVYTTPSSNKNRKVNKKDSNENAEGLHYADLDLAKLPMHERPPPSAYKDSPTEYASIQLFPDNRTH